MVERRVPPFFGREPEIRQLTDRLSDPACRLTSLIGIGGVGKTTLALQVAAACAEHFRDGVTLIDLTAIDDPSLVPLHVQRAFGFGDEEQVPVQDVVIAGLRDRNALIVLDNFEHVLAARGLVDAIYRECPGVWLLLTSRIRPEVDRKTDLTVHPFPVDSHESAASPSGNPALDLMVHELQQLRPGLQLTADDTEVLQRICRKVDGLPLAIMLVARRLSPLLSIREIDEHLDLRMVRAAANDPGNPRHDSLSAILQWSYERLTPEQRAVLHGLAVFNGGATIARLAEVLRSARDADPSAVNADPLAMSDLLDAVEHLRLLGLVRVEQQPSGARYAMLQVIRDYCRALTSGEPSARWDAGHAEALRAFALEARSGLSGPEQSAWFAQVDAELGNLRQAIGWAFDRGESPDLGIEVAASIWLYWRHRGQLAEAIRWLERGIARCGPEPSGPLGRAFLLLGHSIQASPERRTVAYEQAHRIFRALDDLRGQIGALDSLGLVANDQGRFAVAVDALKQAVELARRSGDRSTLAFVVGHLGYVLNRKGEYPAAKDCQLEALEFWKAQESRDNIAFTLLDLGRLERRRRRFDEAEGFRAEAEIAFAASQARIGWAYARHELGLALLAQQRGRQAATPFAESLTALHEASLWDDTVIGCIEGIACLAAEVRPESAERLLAGADHWRQVTKLVAAEDDRTLVSHARSELRKRLDPAVAVREQALGAHATRDELVAFAREAAALAQDPGGLTTKQREILRMTALALSDQEIADQTGTSVNTVRKHQDNIRKQLGVTSRIQAVNEARRRGIIA